MKTYYAIERHRGGGRLASGTMTERDIREEYEALAATRNDRLDDDHDSIDDVIEWLEAHDDGRLRRYVSIDEARHKGIRRSRYGMTAEMTAGEVLDDLGEITHDYCADCDCDGVVVATPDGEVRLDDSTLVLAPLGDGEAYLCASAYGIGDAVCATCEADRAKAVQS